MFFGTFCLVFLSIPLFWTHNASATVSDALSQVLSTFAGRQPQNHPPPFGGLGPKLWDDVNDSSLYFSSVCLFVLLLLSSFYHFFLS